MSKITKSIDPLDVLEVLSHEAGLAAAESKAPPTADELREIDELIGFARSELAKQARADLVTAPAQVRPVRASILAMTSEALRARMNELFAMPGIGRVAVSHQRFVGHASDDDLRLLLDDLETMLADGVAAP